MCSVQQRPGVELVKSKQCMKAATLQNCRPCLPPAALLALEHNQLAVAQLDPVRAIAEPRYIHGCADPIRKLKRRRRFQAEKGWEGASNGVLQSGAGKPWFVPISSLAALIVEADFCDRLRLTGCDCCSERGTTR